MNRGNHSRTVRRPLLDALVAGVVGWHVCQLPGRRVWDRPPAATDVIAFPIA